MISKPQSIKWLIISSAIFLIGGWATFVIHSSNLFTFTRPAIMAVFPLVIAAMVGVAKTTTP